MVLDVRAEIISNLGPVISGSVRDDHIQGQGLIFTSGELTIAGLITPARGAVVELAYITADGSTAARFPRSPFRVVQAFANPLRNETQITIANELAFHKGQSGGSVNSAVTAGVNGRDPSIIATTNLRETAEMICGRVNIDVGSLGTWNLPKQQMTVKCDDYIETLSEILASAGRVGYMSAENKLEVIEYASLGNGGPTITFDNIVDVNPNAGGLDFSERPLGEGEAQTLGEEDSSLADDDDDIEDSLPRYLNIQGKTYGIFKETWTESRSDSWSELSLLLDDGTNVTYKTQETTKTVEGQAEPDNRTISRTQSIINPLVKINSQYIQDHLNAGTPAGGFRPADWPVWSTVTDAYVYEENKGELYGHRTNWTAEEKEQFDQEIETAQQNFSGSGTNRVMDVALLPELPTYRLLSVTSERKMSEEEALGRIGFEDYSELPALPSGSGIESREITKYIYSGGKIKEIRSTYIAHGLTQIGQQSLAAAAEGVDPGASDTNYFSPFLNAFWGLVLDSHSVQIYDDPAIYQEEEVPGYMSSVKNADIVYRGTSQIQVGDSNTPSSASNNTSSFDPSFLPDDVMNDDGTITTAEEAGESAYDALVRYAEEQNLLLLGHRLGMQIVTSLGRLPKEPLAAFHVQNDGITAMYRINAMSWAFDSDSCLVSTDALYWGLVGGSVNGPRWTPVAPGITALPTPPAVVNNGAQDPANSIALTSTVDVSDQTAVNTLINSLPDTQTETFENVLTPVEVSKPFVQIKEVSLSVSPQITVKTVPGGIYRDMGSVVLTTLTELLTAEVIDTHVVVEVDATGPTWSQLEVALDLNVTATTSSVTGTTNWTVTTGDTDNDYPLHGHHSFYADQAAMEADGFTFIGADADDEALAFTPSAAFQGIEFLDGKVPNSPSHAWRLNTNGGVYYDSDPDNEIDFYDEDYITEAGWADLYVGWWPDDTYVRLAGFLEFNDGTRDWLVVRADMAVPYTHEYDGFSVEAWFATDGSISVRYSAAERYDDPNVTSTTLVAGGYSPHATYDANCIVTNGQAIANMGDYSDRYVGLGPNGNYAINFLMN